MRSFLFDMNTQKKLTDQILINDGRYAETATVYIPIVIYECNRDKTDSGIEITVSDVELDNISKSAIKNTAFAELNNIASVEVEKDQTIVSIVGNEIAKTDAVLNKLFAAINEIPVTMVSYGGSPHNISLLIPSSFKTKTLQLINKGLFHL